MKALLSVGTLVSEPEEALVQAIGLFSNSLGYFLDGSSASLDPQLLLLDLIVNSVHVVIQVL